MANDIEKSLEALEEAVVGVNEINTNLEKIKLLHSQFDEKSKSAIDKLSSADKKLEEISAIREEILSTKKDFDKEYDNVVDLVNNTIIPVKNDLLNTKTQISRLQATIDSLKNSGGTARVIETKSPELEKEIQNLRLENAALLNNFKQLEALVSAKTRTASQQNKIANSEYIRKTNNTSADNSGSSELKKFFISKGCEVIDKRQNGGALWVVGDEMKLKPILAEMKTKFGNVSGSFAAGRATKQRRSWFTQDKR